MLGEIASQPRLVAPWLLPSSLIAPVSALAVGWITPLLPL